MGCNQGKTSSPASVQPLDKRGSHLGEYQQARQTLLEAKKTTTETGDGLVTHVRKTDGQVLPVQAFLEQATTPAPAQDTSAEVATMLKQPSVSGPSNLLAVLEEQRRQREADSSNVDARNDLGVQPGSSEFPSFSMQEQQSRHERVALPDAPPENTGTTRASSSSHPDGPLVPYAVGAADPELPSSKNSGLQASTTSTATFGLPGSQELATAAEDVQVSTQSKKADPATANRCEAIVQNVMALDAEQAGGKIEAKKNGGGRKKHEMCCC
jgi:hypothetical protein